MRRDDDRDHTLIKCKWHGEDIDICSQCVAEEREKENAEN